MAEDSNDLTWTLLGSEPTLWLSITMMRASWFVSTGLARGKSLWRQQAVW